MTKDEVRPPALTVTMDIIGSVRANGWKPYVDRLDISLWADSDPVATIHCKSASQAERLAEMMRAPTPVFDAMNLPETPAFPSVKGKA